MGSKARIIASNIKDLSSPVAALVSPQFTGSPTAPSPTSSNGIANKGYVDTALTGYQPLDGDLTNISGLSGTSGFLKKTGTNTWSLDTSTYLTGNQSISFSGDASGTGATSVVLTLSNSGVTSGIYNNSATAITPITVDSKGRITSMGSAVTITPSWSSITSKPTTLSGYGITDALSSSGGTISGALVVTGNLTINGTTTTVNSTVTTIDDPVITLGGDTAPGSDDGKDRGIEFRWHSGTASKIGFFGFDDSTGYLTFIPDATNSSEVFSGTPGDIQATNFRGALIGNSDTSTRLATSRTIAASGDATWSVTFDGSANVTSGITLANSGATAGSYGSSSAIPVITVDEKGRVTSISTTAVNIPSGAITFNGDVTGTGSTGATTTLTLANSGATAGSYGSSSAIPVLTVDAKGRITSISTTAVNIPSGSLTFTGDVSGTGTTGSTTTLSLANSGVTAGTYKSVTVDVKGRVTGGTNPTTLSGYGITDAAPIASPTFTGVVNGPTIKATTAFVLPVGVDKYAV